MRRAAALLAAVLLASCATRRSHAPQLELAVTIDDLPVHAPYPPGTTPNQVNAEMIAVLKAGNVPAIAFVNGVGTEQHPETIVALRAWRSAGFVLGNHTWTHPHLSQISVAEFDQELSKGEPLLESLDGNADWRWFRYPFLDEGKDEAQRSADRQVLARRGYKVADVTMSFSDWQFTTAYARCMGVRDRAAVAELERLYMQMAKDNIAVARETAHKLYGRDIPYVLLMHVSAMSAHMMPKVIRLYRASGFRLVSIRQAESDPAYRAYTDLSLPPPPSLFDVAKTKGVTLPLPPDPTAKLATMCPGGPTATSP
jgi:peptidoglycan/xylan/chitin deacetylase (PgdA/CDA1 family)